MEEVFGDGVFLLGESLYYAWESALFPPARRGIEKIAERSGRRKVLRFSLGRGLRDTEGGSKKAKRSWRTKEIGVGSYCRSRGEGVVSAL